MREEIVNTIREKRSAKGITQAELGKAVGVSRQSIISIERGHYIPSLPLALRIAGFFKLPTDSLFWIRRKDNG
jgi:putative transcriptional regulator